jgi:redox-sensitive bicupin YhaK (pirin superfamily)
VSTEGTRVLHGAQLWVALPSQSRDSAPGFEHYVPAPVQGPGWEARVFLGSLLGSASPVATHSPLLGAEIVLAPGARLTVPVEASYEHGVLVDTGLVSVDGQEAKPADLAYLAPGRATIEVLAHEECRLLLLGGEPFGESIVMWWNFVGRTHDEIVAFRDEWQAQITADGRVVEDGQDVHDGRFGIVVGDHLPPIPAPALPNARLKERR